MARPPGRPCLLNRSTRGPSLLVFYPNRLRTPSRNNAGVPWEALPSEPPALFKQGEKPSRTADAGGNPLLAPYHEVTMRGVRVTFQLRNPPLQLHQHDHTVCSHDVGFQGR